MRLSNPKPPLPAVKPATERQPWIWRACLVCAALVALLSMGPIIVYPFFINFFAFPVACYVAIVACMFLVFPPTWAARLGVIMGTIGLSLVAVAAALPIEVFNFLQLFLREEAMRNLVSLAFMQVVLIGSGYAIRWKAPEALGWLVLLVTILVAIPQTVTFATAARASYVFIQDLNSRRAPRDR
jgi:hypothetical protein